ncbi:MAG: serine/threonine-protein kinase [bacterium]|nr:serine/threonine-protein kinase [bacterium]
MDSLEWYLDQQPGVANPGGLKNGDVVDGWRVWALIGRGGSSEVYRVEHMRNGGFAALKLLLPAKDLETEGRRRQRFQREIEILSVDGIPELPRYCGTGTWRGRPYLLEELLEPQDLPQTDRSCARYLLAVCRGVSELHRRGIVHRDLKPNNILFRASGEPVIVDLGLAKRPTVAGVATDVSLEDGMPIGVGTPGYAAPEQFIGGDISPTADIHALGVLTEQIVTQKEWRSCALTTSCWRRIIHRATSSIPLERYQSVEAFCMAIRRRHWPAYSFVVGVISVASLVGVLAMGHSVPARRDPGKTQSSPGIELEILAENMSLNGATKVYSQPLVLEPNRTYRIIGPGMLDADISGPTNTLLILKNCALINRTRDVYPKNGLRYQLENGVYLNFINQKRRPPQFGRSVLPYDAAYNEVRFAGPETFKKLEGLLNKESRDLLRGE